MKKIISKINKSLLIYICVLVLVVVSFGGYRYFRYIDEVAFIDIYYLNTAKMGIEPITKSYSSNLDNDQILDVVFKIFSDSQQASKSTLVTSKPESVTILDYELDSQGLMTVSFSPEYKEMTNIEEINFKAAFVWTFTDLDFVKKIKFEIDGYPYTTANSQVIESFDRTNVIVEPTIALDKAVQREVTLYYLKEDDDGKWYLTAEQRTATAQEGTAIEEVVINELLKGSAEGNKDIIPSNVRVRQIKRENAICFIDLDEAFLKGNLTEREQELRVYSLVNSLTELSYIDKVQILINAKKTKGFEDIDISKPLKRNEYYIR